LLPCLGVAGVAGLVLATSFFGYAVAGVRMATKAKRKKLTKEQALRAAKHVAILKRSEKKKPEAKRMDEDQIFAIAASKARRGELNKNGEWVKEAAA
jgi:hypothetical protein